MIDPASYLKGDDLIYYHARVESVRDTRRSMVCPSCLNNYPPRDSGLCVRCEAMEKGWDASLFTPWRSIAPSVRFYLCTVAAERAEFERNYYALKHILDDNGIEPPKFARSDPYS